MIKRDKSHTRRDWILSCSFPISTLLPMMRWLARQTLNGVQKSFPSRRFQDAASNAHLSRQKGTISLKPGGIPLKSGTAVTPLSPTTRIPGATPVEHTPYDFSLREEVSCLSSLSRRACCCLFALSFLLLHQHGLRQNYGYYRKNQHRTRTKRLTGCSLGNGSNCNAAAGENRSPYFYCLQLGGLKPPPL